MPKRPIPSMIQSNVLRRVASHPSGHVIGIDEVGLGACAGPLVVAGVLARTGWDHELAHDSKKLSEKRRAQAYEAIVGRREAGSDVLAVLVASYEAHQVDHLGVERALRDLMREVATSLHAIMPAAILVDGDAIAGFDGIPRENVFFMVGADAIHPVVGIASVIAKVHRDVEMVHYHQVHPEYGWSRNKGYGTRDHDEAMKAHGVTILHRVSYKNVARYVVKSKEWHSLRQPRETRAWTSFLLR